MHTRRNFLSLGALGALGIAHPATASARLRVVTVEHTLVKSGEGLLAVAARLAPAGITFAQKQAFAATIATASNLASFTATIYTGQVLHYDTATIPVVGAPAPVPAPVPVGTFPTATSTGVLAGVGLTTSTLRRTTAFTNIPTKTIDGVIYTWLKNYQFLFTNDYFYCDAPTYFENCLFVSTGLVSNTSAMVQANSVAKNALIFDHCSFDGGPYHNRNAQSDYGLKVYSANCTRFGNAAFEMNNRDGTADMEVRDSYLFEPKGWQPADHTDGIQVGGGRNVTIVNNTVRVTSHNTDGGASNSCLGLWAELGNVTGTVLVDHCLLSGGGKIMYLEQKSPYSWQGQVTVQNNTFSREFESHGGIWGVLYPSGLPSKLAWLNNVWDDGTAVSLAQAVINY